MRDITPHQASGDVADMPAPKSGTPRVDAAPGSALVLQEAQWRWPAQAGACLPDRPDAIGSDAILVSRWRHHGDAPAAVSHPGHPTHHCIALALRTTTVRFFCRDIPVVDGRLVAGSAHVTRPGTPTRAVYGAAADVLHLFVPSHVVAQWRPDDARLIADPALERLGQALVMSDTDDPALGRLFAAGVAQAIVARVMAHHAGPLAPGGNDMTALPQWRLRRAMAFIDANLASPIGLADIAGSAGLTRMYFAAQFRRATGMRPHEYLVRRRIEHAQDLLRRNEGGMLDVAMRCGFRSQAHFTTVFKRLVGDTPYCWRIKTTSTSRSADA